MPPIAELSRIEPVYLGRLEKEGVFTTGILLEVSETPTRRQSLADHTGASILEVLTWRDEALLLNLAAFGPAEHVLLAQAGFRGLDAVLRVDLARFQERVLRAARDLRAEPPTELTMTGWWEQARTLETPPEEETLPTVDAGGIVLRFVLGLAIGVGTATVAAALAPADSALGAIAVIVAIGAIGGAVAGVALSGVGGFLGLLAGSALVFALLLGRGVLVALPNTPLWTDQGISFTLGLGAGPPAVIAGWLVGRVGARRRTAPPLATVGHRTA
ncbi:MAG: DUF4332 domain-containing protein [Chloroflexi bacterium]|nr:DUF4332 domain-containing protein [Chloroflexota bacterium]